MDELRKRQKIISQLVEVRLEQGISQAELARRLGIQRSGINRLESGTQNPTLDMILKIASALGKDVSLELNDKEEPMSHVYSLRIYDTELMRFSMEKQGLSGLVAEILYTNEEQAHLLPLDMERTGEGVIHWLERRVIPKNRAFVDEILKTLGLSHNDTRGIIDVCRGLSLNDSYWVVPEGFEGKFSQYNLYENRFSEILALVAYTGAGGSRQAFTTSPELTTGGMLPKAWRYGRMRQRYLKEHRPSLYSSLILSEKLYPHLLEIDRAARERMDAMLPRMMEAAGVTEELKARDPMRWVGLMNTLKAQAEEIIQSELIFQ